MKVLFSAAAAVALLISGACASEMKVPLSDAPSCLSAATHQVQRKIDGGVTDAVYGATFGVVAGAIETASCTLASVDPSSKVSAAGAGVRPRTNGLNDGYLACRANGNSKFSCLFGGELAELAYYKGNATQ